MNENSYEYLVGHEGRQSRKYDIKYAEVLLQEGLDAASQYLDSIGATKKYEDMNSILLWLAQYTKKDTNKQEVISNLKQVRGVVEVEEKDNKDYSCKELLIKTEQEELKMIPLVNVLPDMENLIPDLETDERLQRCYSLAWNIAFNLGNKCDVVTGYIYGFCDKAKYLHSWIEIPSASGKMYVMDGTINAFMSKENYYKLRRAEQLTRVSNKTMKEDARKYLQYFENIDPCTYFLFRDELIKNLENNEQLFEEERRRK